jgi:hypothetical protein
MRPLSGFLPGLATPRALAISFALEPGTPNSDAMRGNIATAGSGIVQKGKVLCVVIAVMAEHIEYGQAIHRLDLDLASREHPGKAQQGIVVQGGRAMVDLEQAGCGVHVDALRAVSIEPPGGEGDAPIGNIDETRGRHPHSCHARHARIDLFDRRQ